MVKIINEVGGVKYELKADYGDAMFESCDACELCDLREQCPEDGIVEWGGRRVCAALQGFWKKV